MKKLPFFPRLFRSDVVGWPLSLLLSNDFAKITPFFLLVLAELGLCYGFGPFAIKTKQNRTAATKRISPAVCCYLVFLLLRRLLLLLCLLLACVYVNDVWAVGFFRFHCKVTTVKALAANSEKNSRAIHPTMQNPKKTLFFWGKKIDSIFFPAFSNNSWSCCYLIALAGEGSKEGKNKKMPKQRRSFGELGRWWWQCFNASMAGWLAGWLL